MTLSSLRIGSSASGGFLFQHVEARSGDPAILQGLRQRLLVDDRAAGRV